LLPGQSWSTNALAGIREWPSLTLLCGPALEFFPVNFEPMKNLNGCVGCLAGRGRDAFQKKLDPFFANPFSSDALKEIVVTLAVSLEIKDSSTGGACA
jgi:hypothetical protein